MADFEFTAGFSDLHTLVRLLDSEIPKSAKASASVFSREFSKVEKEFKTTATAAQNYYNSILGVSKSQSSAKASASAFAPIIKDIDQDLRMAADAAEHYNKQLLGINNTSKSAKSSADIFKQAFKDEENALKSLSKATQDQAREVDQLTARYNPLKAAYNQQIQELQKIRRAQELDIISKEQVSQAVQKLRADYAAFKAGTTDATNRFVQGVNSSSRGMNRMGVATQQAGYQVGDFLVQVQSGTNWMVAFGQQATQLVGILPMFNSFMGLSGNALIGLSAGLGIAIPLVTAIGAAFMRTRKSAEESSKGVKTLEDSIRSLDESLKDWLRTKQASSMGITIDELLGTESLVKAEKNLKSAKKEYEELLDTIQGSTGQVATGILLSEGFKSLWGGDAESQVTEALNEIIEAENRLATLRKKQSEERFANFSSEKIAMDEQIALIQTANRYGEESLEYKRLQNEQDLKSYQLGLQNQELTNSQRLALYNLYSTQLEMENSQRGLNSITEAGLTIWENLKLKVEEAEERARELEEEVGKAGVAALRLSGIDLTSNISSAAKEAARLAGNLGIALNAAISLQNMRDTLQYSGRGGDPRQFMEGGRGSSGTYSRDINYETVDDIIKSLTPKGSKSGGKSGGSSKGTKVGSDAFSFIQDLLGTDDVQSQINQLEVWLEETLLKYSEFNAKEIEILSQHNINKLAIEEEYQRRLQEIRNAEQAATLNNYGSLFGAIGNLMGSEGKKLLQIQAGLSAAATMISTYEGAARQASKASDPLTAAGIWAAWVAKGVQAVATIKQIGSSGSTSGSSGGGSSGAISTPSTVEEKPQTVLIQGLESGMKLSPEDLQEVFDQLYEENGRRGTIFKVAL